MSCEFRAVVEGESNGDTQCVILPVITTNSIEIKDKNPIYKERPGLKSKIHSMIVNRTKKGVCKVKSFVVIARNRRKSFIKVVVLVTGKSKPSLSKLEDTLRDFNDKGRVSGLWKFRVPLNGVYGDIDIRKVVKTYKDILEDYPGIVEFEVSEEDVPKIMRVLKKK